MLIDGEHARRTLAAIRLFNGALALLAPQLLIRRLGTDPDRDPSAIYPFRMFGVRTLIIGADLLVLNGEEQRRATKLAVLIHASDTASAATCLVKGYLPRKAGIVATGVSSLNTILAVIAAQDRGTRLSQPAP